MLQQWAEDQIKVGTEVEFLDSKARYTVETINAGIAFGTMRFQPSPMVAQFRAAGFHVESDEVVPRSIPLHRLAKAFWAGEVSFSHP